MTNIVLGGTRNGSNLVLSPTQLAAGVTINLVISGSTMNLNTPNVSLSQGVMLILSPSICLVNSSNVAIAVVGAVVSNIIPTPLKASTGVIDAFTTVLTGYVRMPYTPGCTLIFTNPTYIPLTVNVKGDKSTTIFPDGYGEPIDVAAGKNITVDPGRSKAVRVDNIVAFLSGKVFMTGGNGLIVYLLQ